MSVDISCQHCPISHLAHAHAERGDRSSGIRQPSYRAAASAALDGGGHVHLLRRLLLVAEPDPDAGSGAAIDHVLHARHQLHCRRSERIGEAPLRIPGPDDRQEQGRDGRLGREPREQGPLRADDGSSHLRERGGSGTGRRSRPGP